MLFDVFSNLLLLQKMDLGPCNKIHDPALKADFEIASEKRDYGYDIDVSLHELC